MAMPVADDWGHLPGTLLTDNEADRLAEELGLSAPSPPPEVEMVGPSWESTIISSETMTTLCQRQRGPWAATHLTPAITAATQLEGGVKTRLSQSIPPVAGFFFNEQATHLSKEALGQVVGVSAEMVEDSLSQMANCLLHIEQGQRHALEEAITAGVCKPILYLDLSRYNETPMKITHKELMSNLLLCQAPEPAVGHAAEDPTSTPLSSRPPTGLPMKAATSSKMFFAEGRVSMLAEAAFESPQGLRQELFVVNGLDLSWNQILDRDTGACQYAALQQSSQVSKHANDFPLKVRLTTTDQAGANHSSERLMLASRGAGWVGVHLACNVHIAARVVQRTVSLEEPIVSGMLNVSLTLADGAAMTRYRRSLVQVLESRIVFLHSQPSAEALAYRDFVLDNFCRTGTSQEVRRQLLLTYANGDWRQRDVFQHCVPAGVAFDDRELKQHIIQAMLQALTPTLFKVYPRHRWVGCDLATDQLLLIECVHGLGSASFLTMCGQRAGEQQVRALDEPQDPGASALAGVAMAPASASGEQRADAVNLDSEAPAASAEGGLQFGQPHQPEAGTTADDAADSAATAQEKARRRRAALEFYRGQPLAPLMLARFCMKPMCALLQLHLSRGGHA